MVNILSVQWKLISTDEDPNVRIESFAITNLRVDSTKLPYSLFCHPKMTNFRPGRIARERLIFITSLNTLQYMYLDRMRKNVALGQL